MSEKESQLSLFRRGSRHEEKGLEMGSLATGLEDGLTRQRGLLTRRDWVETGLEYTVGLPDRRPGCKSMSSSRLTKSLGAVGVD